MSRSIASASPWALLGSFVVAGMAQAQYQYAEPDREAQMVETTAVGGEGGGPFRLLCPRGSYLTGLDARAGAWIDAIGPACRPWSEQAGVFRGDDRPLLMAGGSTGGATAMRCRRNAALSGIVGGLGANEDRTVSFVQFNCRRIDQPSQHHQQQESGPIRFGLPHRKNGLKMASVEVECPAGHWAVGIFGRSGVYVDSLGLVCEPGPKKKAPPPVQPAPPTRDIGSDSSTLRPYTRPAATPP